MATIPRLWAVAVGCKGTNPGLELGTHVPLSKSVDLPGLRFPTVKWGPGRSARGLLGPQRRDGGQSQAFLCPARCLHVLGARTHTSAWPPVRPPSVPSSEAQGPLSQIRAFPALLGDGRAGDGGAMPPLQQACVSLECVLPPPPLALWERGGAAGGAPPGPEEHPLPVPQFQKALVPGPEASETVDGIRAPADLQSPHPGAGVPAQLCRHILLLGLGLVFGK